MKRNVIALISLLAVFVLIVGVILCTAKEPSVEDLEQLLKNIYGEEFVVKLPYIDTFARINLSLETDSEGNRQLELQPLTTEGRFFDSPEYMQGPYTLTTGKRKYKVGETVDFTFSNNSNDPYDVIRYGNDFLLDIRIDGVWYPLCPEEGPVNMAGLEVAPGESNHHEITSKSLSIAYKIKYNEFTDKYKIVGRVNNEIVLIPGHYRYGIIFDAKQGRIAYCEFDVVE